MAGSHAQGVGVCADRTGGGIVAASSRESARDDLVTFFTAELLGAGNPAQQVTNGLPKDLSAGTPAVAVTSGGTKRAIRGMGTLQYRTEHRIIVLVFVADAIDAESRTNQDVENDIDSMEQAIADSIASHRGIGSGSETWDYAIQEDQFSNVVPAIQSGKPYLMEAIPVIATVHD